MAVIKSYPNGGSVATSGHTPRKPPKRGAATGWSQAAARRNSEFLQSIRLEDLDGTPIAATLTLPAGSLAEPIAPPSPEVWHRMIASLFKRLRRLGMLRAHWVTEFTRRRTPHLHVALWMPEDFNLALIIVAWVQIAQAAGWNAAPQAQDVRRIDSVGWLQYMAKHGARGVRMYQRSADALPDGWEKPGRMWGHPGAWPSADDREPMRYDLPTAAMWRYRRLLRSWAIANARRTKNRRIRARYVRQARSLLRCSDKRLSPVRPVSMWIPEDVQLALIGLLIEEGVPVFERAHGETLKGRK